MRHGDKINNLGRKKAHRVALMQNLTSQLIEHKRIFTTLAKAKALRQFAEPLLNKAKNDTTHNRRVVFSQLQSKEAIKELFGDIATKIASRPGGYTRIIKMQNRLGDAAEMAMIELVDFNELYSGKNESSDSASKKKRTRRKTSSSTPSKDTSSTSQAAETSTEVETELPVVDTVVESSVVVNNESTPVVEETTPVEDIVAVAETPAEEENTDSNDATEEKASEA